MKPTKKQELEIMKVYEAYWAEYLNGNVEGMRALLDASYTQVGSAESEVFSSKKDAVQFLIDTIDQVAGKLKMRNRSTNLEQQNGLVLVHEHCDLYALSGKNWIFYSKFRASTLLQEKKEGWKITHQHSSFPDTKTEEGQNVAIEKIESENQQLHEAIKRRTVELEQKNRELEVESALEKVRSRTMAMQHSDELQETSFLLDEQVRALGIKTWGCAFNIYGEKDSTEWFGNEKGILPTYTVPRKGIFKKYYDYGQKGEEFIVEEFKGKACVNHYEYMSSLPVIGDVLKNLKKTNKGFPTYQLDHVVFFKYGYLLFITKEHVPEAHDIFKRFAKVFEQTYTRFLDLQKAEAQAREAQIETALEKVRSRTMAMQKGEELQDVVVLLYKELIALGVTNFATCGYVEINEKTNKQATWVTNPGGDSLGLFYLPLTGDVHFDARYDAWKNQQTVFRQTVAGKVRRKHLEYAITTFQSKEAEEMVLNQFPDPTVFYCFNFSHGYLHLVAGSQLTQDEESLLARFTKVFEQTYARFLDLKKAEEQARESEIELALERVRARSMAMQKSEELKEVIKIVYQQLTHLKINLNHTGFVVDYTPKGDWHFWIADEQDIPSQISHPYFESVWANQFNDAKEKDEDFFTTNLNFEEKNKFYNELLTFIPGLPKASKDFYLSCPGLTASTVLLDNVGLYIENFEGIPYTDEENNILMRFGKVFQQTYTRFLDLQKAEAQAREAQIEAALEKVRSRSLAMQISDELQEVVQVVAEKIQELNVVVDSTGVIICTYPEDTKDVIHWTYTQDEERSQSYYMPYFEHPIWDEAWESKNSGVDYFSKTYPKGVKNRFLRTIFRRPDSGYSNLPEEYKQWQLNSPIYNLSFAWGKNSAILVPNNDGKEPNEEQRNILIRFAKVFEQSYVRFIDLQKAEAQAKEAQIEAALEKVRSRSLAMHKSEELNEVILEVHKKFMDLDISMESRVAVVAVFDQDSKDFNQYVASHDISNMRISTPYFKHPVLDDFETAKEAGVDFYSKAYSLEEKNNYFKTFFETSNFGKIEGIAEQRQWALEQKFYTYSPAFQKNSSIGIADFSGIPLTEIEIDIIKRFSKVFEQAYIRFLDLQKSEKQAREAQIEAALEKVRSRTMAMHKSEELPEAANNLFLQVQALGIPAWSAGYCIWEDDKKSTWCNMSSEGEIQKGFSLPTIGEGYNFSNPLKKGESFHVAELGGKKLVRHYDFMKTLPVIGEILEEFDKVGISLPTFQIFHIVYFTHGYLMFITYEPVPNDWDIFKRFGKVFEQTYTRFLDLQKVEAQAREAQIETALEKVRSRTMAMHKSEELAETALVLYEQFSLLGNIPDRMSIGIFKEETKEIELWPTDQSGSQLNQSFTGSWEKSTVWTKLYEAWKADNDSFVVDLSGQKLKTWLKFIREEIKLFVDDSHMKGRRVQQAAFFSHGMLLFTTNEPVAEKIMQLLIRFAKVFSQTYTRFLDLRKAEAQAREAQVEGALERVRSKTMAMHNSQDVAATVVTLFDEVLNLGLDKSIRCGIGILEGNEGMETWSATSLPNGKVDLKTGMLDMTIHPLLVKIKNSWKSGNTSYTDQMSSKDVIKYYTALNNDPGYQFNVDLNTLHKKEFHNSFSFPEGIIFSFSPNPMSAEATKVFGKFAHVFGQTYRRYLDLIKAEAQAREAIKQASLDRVRGEIASMRATEDLQRITPLVFNELTTLGVPFFRCGVFIVHEKEKNLEVYLSARDGHSLGVLRLPFNVNLLTQNSVENWKKNKVYHQHWNKEEFVEWTESMMERGQIQDVATYQGAAAPPDSLDLHFIPFTQGMLYVGNTEQLNEDDVDLVRSLADAFAIAYARYEDFVNLDKAKASIETTLTELKATQNQLVQSEKMASLGELTAGIAHEIQNPLNFVNNFSEVSKELIEEMMEEIEKGDVEEVKALSEDIIQNLEKIHHHGQRADGIVKGMLQHSRTSSGEKELIDINVLADEYLRLAYHGLRAKDKSFNATLETDFDETLEKVNVVAQDIGRVILNLITNAFYVVKEKSSEALAKENKKYEPTVSVTTKKITIPSMAGGVEIRVKDNGNGIPEVIKEKIFQPFFTTKPTGQGTGLGLSMSYDIITKGHKGELKVETKEGEGTTFTIILPKG